MAQVKGGHRFASTLTIVMTEEASVFVVVLTGGPGAGKSSSLAFLRERLSLRGFQVLTVPENATHFFENSDGMQKAWVGTHTQVVVQRMLLDYQLHQEDGFRLLASLHPDKKRSVILLDACAMSGKVYVSAEQWKEVLAFPGKQSFTDDELFRRYNLVVHLVTSAYEEGCESWWNNNPARWHTPEAAKEADEKCLNVFKPHHKQVIVPSCKTFDEKKERVLELIADFLHSNH